MEGLPKDVANLIFDHLPEFYRRISRCVCKKWAKIIKINKNIHYDEFLISGIFAEDDNDALLKWFVKDIKYLKREHLDLQLVTAYGAAKCLRMCFENFERDIDLSLISQLETTNEKKRESILEILFPLMTSTLENRILTILWCRDDYVLQWLVNHGVVTEVTLLKIQKEGFKNMNIVSLCYTFSFSRFIERLSKWFVLSRGFVKVILDMLWINKQLGYKNEICSIIKQTGVWKSRICKYISQEIHDEYRSICKCGEASKRKKIKI